VADGRRGIGAAAGIPRPSAANHPPHDLVLQHEEIGQVAVEALGPEMTVGRRLDQLDIDPHPGSPPAGRCPR